MGEKTFKILPSGVSLPFLPRSAKGAWFNCGYLQPKESGWQFAGSQGFYFSLLFSISVIYDPCGWQSLPESSELWPLTLPWWEAGSLSAGLMKCGFSFCLGKPTFLGLCLVTGQLSLFLLLLFTGYSTSRALVRKTVVKVRINFQFSHFVLFSSLAFDA